MWMETESLMLMTRDYEHDFDSLIETLSPSYSGSPLAFSRFADGEAAIIFGGSHSAKSDGWEWHGGRRSELPQRLKDALQYAELGYHLGITAEEHHPRDHKRLLNEVKLGLSFITYAEIFIFANYQRFQRMTLDHCCTIGGTGEVRTPKTPDDVAWNKTIDELVPFMVECSRPMLVSAGPWACVLIHEYWKRCPKNMRRVVLDVGSAMDEKHRGRKTRRYQKPGNGLQSWRPKWEMK